MSDPLTHQNPAVPAGRAEVPLRTDIAPDTLAAWDTSSAHLPRKNPHEVRAMLAAGPSDWQPFPQVDDRAGWDAAARRLGSKAVDELTVAGQAAAREDIPLLTASLWRTFLRNGERPPYETPWYQRRRMLADILVAYALAPTGDLLEAMTDLVWAICEETSWCFPAHDHSELPDPRRPVVDLFASLTAVGLAEVVAVAGPDLPAALVQRVRCEADQRVITPYRVDDTWKWLYNGPDDRASNWAAVCAFGAVGAACYLEEDPAALGTMLCKAARSMEEFLENFDPDGGTSEGVGYWSFGFGAFCQLADLVERRTGGAWSWFEAPIVRSVATFPLRARTTATSWVSFSDADPDVVFPGWLLHDLAKRFNDEDLGALAGGAGDWRWHRANSAITTALRSVHCVAHGRRTLPSPAPQASEWFRGLQWLISRADPADPATLALAVKGGHNNEMHNHNDIGSLIVRYGGEDLVVDPGRGQYSRDSFNENRYKHLVNRSRGHSIPSPDGIEQQAGAQYKADVLALRRSEESDEVTYDLTRAYPEHSELTALHRTVRMHRGDDPHVRVSDSFAFAGHGVAESSFATFADVEVLEDHVVLRGEEASLTLQLPSDTSVRVVVESDEVALKSSTRVLRRITVRTTTPVAEATLTFTLRPHLPAAPARR